MLKESKPATSMRPAEHCCLKRSLRSPEDLNDVGRLYEWRLNQSVLIFNLWSEYFFQIHNYLKRESPDFKAAVASWSRSGIKLASIHSLHWAAWQHSTVETCELLPKHNEPWQGLIRCLQPLHIFPLMCPLTIRMKSQLSGNVTENSSSHGGSVKDLHRDAAGAQSPRGGTSVFKDKEPASSCFKGTID